MTIPHGLLGKACVVPFAVVVVAASVAIVTGTFWICAGVLAVLFFCFWLAYGSPNGGRWPHRE